MDLPQYSGNKKQIFILSIFTKLVFVFFTITLIYLFRLGMETYNILDILPKTNLTFLKAKLESILVITILIIISWLPGQLIFSVWLLRAHRVSSLLHPVTEYTPKSTIKLLLGTMIPFVNAYVIQNVLKQIASNCSYYKKVISSNMIRSFSISIVIAIAISFLGLLFIALGGGAVPILGLKIILFSIVLWYIVSVFVIYLAFSVTKTINEVSKETES